MGEFGNGQHDECEHFLVLPREMCFDFVLEMVCGHSGEAANPPAETMVHLAYAFVSPDSTPYRSALGRDWLGLAPHGRPECKYYDGTLMSSESHRNGRDRFR